MFLHLFLNMIFLALLTASLAMFFQKCLEPNMIFSGYGDWLHRNVERYDKEVYRRETMKVDISTIPYGIKILKILSYPLGYCRYCNGTSIAILSYLAIFGFYQEFFVPKAPFLYFITNFVILLLFLGVNFLFILLISTIYDKHFSEE